MYIILTLLEGYTEYGPSLRGPYAFSWGQDFEYSPKKELIFVLLISYNTKKDNTTITLVTQGYYVT